MMINNIKKTLYNDREYIIVLLIVLISNLLWYNFTTPPITGNSSFDIYPYRNIFILLKPFDFYSWPVSYIPPILGIPNEIVYSIFYFISNNSYGFAIFVDSIIWEILGAFSLFYLSKKFLLHNNLNKNFAYFSILFLVFNEEIVNGASFDTSASLIIISIAIIYLVLFKSYKYSLLAGIFSFFLLAGFPGSTLVYLEEIIVILLVFVIAIVLLKKYKNKYFMKNFILGVSFSVVFIIMANSYFIFPYLGINSLYVSALSAVNPSYAFSFGYDKIETLQNAVRLINNWADFTGYAPVWMLPYLKNPFINIILYTVPFLALLSIFLKHKKLDLLIYASMLLTIFLAKANNPPFGYFFKYLIDNFNILRPFYNGSSFSPFLIIEYSFLLPISIASIYSLIGKIEKKDFNFKLKKTINYTKKIFPVIIVIIMLVSVFPQLSPELVHGNQSNPLESKLPTYYYNASNFLMRTPNTPVMIFPQVNTFNSNTYDNITWYSGVDIYPGIIYNPSISNAYALNYVGGKGSVYNILSYIYNPNFFSNHLTLENNIKFQNESKILNSNISYSAYLSGSPFNDSITHDKNNLTYIVNKSEYHNGGQWLIGSINPSINIDNYDYLILNYTLNNINTSNMELGLFSDGVGNWYSFTSYVKIENEKYNYLVIPFKAPSTNGGLNNYSNITNIVVNYLGYDKNTTSHYGRISISGIGLIKNNPVNYNVGSKYIYHALKLLDIGYAYVDTSINSGNGTFYNMLFSLDPTQFKLVFHEKSIYIYQLYGNSSLFSSITKLDYYNNTNELYSNLYDNLTINGMAFVNSSLNIKKHIYSNTTVNCISDKDNVYKLNIEHNYNTSIVEFKTDYNDNWVAYSSNVKLKHIEINGFANAWIIPANVTSITIHYKGSNEYRYIEGFTFSLPLVEVIAFFLVVSRKIKVLL